MILALTYGEVLLSDLPDILLKASTTTATVLMLVGASMAMTWVLSYQNIPQSLAAALLAISGDKVVLLLLMNLILLAVGTFMDITPAVLIFTPILLPVTTELGVDPTHFGIILVLNLCVGLCTPPVGSVLFVGVGVSGVPITGVFQPLIPFYLAMVTVLIIVTYTPWISLWLPRMFGY